MLAEEALRTSHATTHVRQLHRVKVIAHGAIVRLDRRRLGLVACFLLLLWLRWWDVFFVVAARVVLRRAKQAVKRSQWHILATLREVDTAAGGVQALVQALHRDAVDFNELGSLDSALAFPHDGW